MLAFRTLLLAAPCAMALATPSAAQSIPGPVSIGDIRNCSHVRDPALAARVGTLSLSTGNMQAMFGGVSGSDPRMTCSGYVARNMCSGQWAKTAMNGLGATEFFSIAMTTLGAVGGSAPQHVQQGAGTGALAGGFLGGLAGAMTGKNTFTGALKGGAAGAALGGAIGGVGASVVKPARALSACQALQSAMPGEINAMISAGALRPARTDADLRATLVAWRGRLTDPTRIATWDALISYSDGIAARVKRNTGR